MRWKERTGSRLFSVRNWAWTIARAAADYGVDYHPTGSLDTWGGSFPYHLSIADNADPKFARIAAHVSSSSRTHPNTVPCAERFSRWEVGFFVADAGQYPISASPVDGPRAQNLAKNFLAGKRSVFNSARSKSIGDLDVGVDSPLASTDGFYAPSGGNHIPSATSGNIR